MCLTAVFDIVIDSSQWQQWLNHRLLHHGADKAVVTQKHLINLFITIGLQHGLHDRNDIRYGWLITQMRTTCRQMTTGSLNETRCFLANGTIINATLIMTRCLNMLAQRLVE